jgi:hypothetical protein
MTAYEIASSWQLKFSNHKLEDRINWHQNNGLVFITPGLLVLANEARYTEGDLELGAAPNAWFIELAVRVGGKMRLLDIFNVLPVERDWVTWCRRGSDKLHAHRWGALSEFLNRGAR